YLVHLEPDLKELVFSGFTRIELIINEGLWEDEPIIVNAKNLEIKSCKIGREIDFTSFMDAEYEYNKEKEEIRVKLPAKIEKKIREKKIEKPDRLYLYFEFSGELNDMLLGFYRSRYEKDGETRYIATTQFEEREARAAFPCFDHPIYKATFDIEFLVEKDLMGISNMDVKEEVLIENTDHGDPNEPPKKLIRFERTPKMSSYLLYFGVGEFEFLEDTSREPKIRVVSTPGKKDLGHFALDMGRKSIDFGNEYTGIPYPLPKCDYIGVQDFAFGAMENFGAITFRENYLLLDPKNTPKPILVRTAEVIAHETAHMWFGDLVSPKDWKYLWLNESFATFFTYAIPDKYFPEWHDWERFILEVQSGLNRDALTETIPIELLGESSEVYIDPSSAPIIYSKGAAIIRVLQGYLGDETFRKGIKYFLEKYKFDNASSGDYWDAFEEATGEPIKKFANSWIFQAGHPIINVKKVILDKDTNKYKLILTQKRFTYLNKEYDTLWFIPVKIGLWKANVKADDTGVLKEDIIGPDGNHIEIEEKVIQVIMDADQKEIEVDIPPGYNIYKLNYGQTGFYRVKYEDGPNLKNLGWAVKNNLLSGEDKFNIIYDLEGLVRRGDYTLDRYLDFIETYYMEELSFLSINEIASELLKYYFLFDDKRERVMDIGRRLYDNVLDKIGLMPREDDTVQIAELRDKLLWNSYLFGSEKVKSFGEEMFGKMVNGEEIPTDIKGAIFKIGAYSGGEAGKDYLIKRLESSKTLETEKMYILMALGCLNDEKYLKEIMKYNEEKVPKRNKMLPIYSIASNIKSKGWLWDYFKENFGKYLEDWPTNVLQNTLTVILPLHGASHMKEAEAFIKENLMNKKEYKATGNMLLELVKIYGKYFNQ
ncbi:MAG: M1 family metallopeptidase, partial [Promethearchaeota archaeon]